MTTPTRCGAPAPPAPDAADEEDLARGLRAADEHTFAAIYRRWAPLVHGMARRSLGDACEAEDVTQQVFLGAWRGREAFRPERGPLGAWLVGITRRRIADALDARTRRLALADAVARGAGPGGAEGGRRRTFWTGWCWSANCPGCRGTSGACCACRSTRI